MDDWQKWTALFLQKPEAAVLRAYADSTTMHRLGDLADVDVGIVTGRNRFFVVSQEQARELQLGDRALDVVGRTSALQSTRFTDADMQRYAGSNRSKLLHLSGLPRAAFSPSLAAYVAQGEAEGVDAGYKCRIRNRWFDVPSVGVPDAFLFRQIHTAPLLVANQAGATSTDTIHRTRVHTGVDRERLCGAMINSLTFASAEVGGRSYGGGVLELEPREAERLLVPYEFATGLDLDYMEERLRAGDLPSALAHGDDVLLRHGCGMSRTELEAARSGWDRLPTTAAAPGGWDKHHRTCAHCGLSALGKWSTPRTPNSWRTPWRISRRRPTRPRRNICPCGAGPFHPYSLRLGRRRPMRGELRPHMPACASLRRTAVARWVLAWRDRLTRPASEGDRLSTSS